MVVQCKTCGSCHYDTERYIGCPSCYEKAGKDPYRPRPADQCSLGECERNGRPFAENEYFRTDGTPGCAICHDCAVRVGLGEGWARVRARPGHVWTKEDVRKAMQ